MKRFLTAAIAIVLLGAGCTGQVQDNVSAVQDAAQQNIDTVTGTVSKVQKVSEDAKTLSDDLHSLFGNADAPPDAPATDAPPSADPPQP